jgi:hypothetical protein
MNMQALTIRAVVMAVVCLALSVAMVLGRPQAASSAAPAAPATTATMTGTSAATPAVPVLLPTVSIRPSLAELSAAENAGNIHPKVTGAPGRTVARNAATAPTLPRLGLDMPYYSFGKALPRVSKE